MLQPRGPNFGVSRLNICVSGKKITHFMLHSRGPDFSYQRLKIHVFGHKLDTLCSTRADKILVFRALKSVFKLIN